MWSIRRTEWTITRTKKKKKPKRTHAQFKIGIIIAQGTTPLKSIICAAFLFLFLDSFVEMIDKSVLLS